MAKDKFQEDFDANLRKVVNTNPERHFERIIRIGQTASEEIFTRYNEKTLSVQCSLAPGEPLFLFEGTAAGGRTNRNPFYSENMNDAIPLQDWTGFIRFELSVPAEKDYHITVQLS